jgi:ankyrin repeat protein
MKLSGQHVVKWSVTVAMIIGFSNLPGGTAVAAGESDFIHAVRADKTEKVVRLIADGADVDQQDQLGRTPLHHAAEAGARSVVPLLIAAGADIEARDAGGATPLLVGGCRERMATTLVAYGARVNAADNNGTTLLHLACRNCVTSVGLVLALGADANLRDLRGRAPLHELVPLGQQTQIIETPSREEESESYLSPSTGNPASQNHGWRHTLRGSEQDVLHAVAMLLDRQADVNAADLEGRRPLDMVCLDSVRELLINHGAEPGTGPAP